MPRWKPALLVCLTLSAALVAPASAGRQGGWVTGALPVPYAARTNHSAEPAIAASPDGTLWAASNFFNPPCANLVSGCGTDVWRSADGGRSWRWLGNPFRSLPGDPAEGFGGYDVDVAVAPEPNAAGIHNVYVASLWTGGDSIAVSRDDGLTWSVLPLVTPVGLVDRPWLQAEGACTVYFAAKDVLSDLTAFRRLDACAPLPVPTGASSAFPPATRVRTGRFAVDSSRTSPYLGAIYYPGVDETTRRVVVSTSADRGSTWQLRDVAPFETGVFVPIWPVTAATDARGWLYLAWHDGTTSYVASSKDGARTWSRPQALHPPAHTGVFPTIAATGAGRVAVAWYGTDREGPADAVDAMGSPEESDAAAWRLLVARSEDGGRRWGRAERVSPVIHRGRICVSGTLCASDGSRALLDCFGMAFDTRGRLAGVFTNALPRVGPDRDGTSSHFLAQRP